MRSPAALSRRRAVTWRTPALLVVALATLVTFGAAAGGGTASSAAALPLPTEDLLRPEVASGPATAGGSTEERAATTVFATVGRLDLHALSADTQVHGFHEAGSPGSLELTPVGERNRVLPSRGRGRPPTSAVDVVMLDDDPVRSPVEGTVRATDHYDLYGRVADRRVVIQPDDAPRMRVVLLHLQGLRVEVGDRVVAGETVIADQARQLPFSSQVDRETAPDAWPHVHVEVEQRG